MKIRVEQLSAHLKKGLSPVYYVYGDEPLFVQEACMAIRVAAQQQGYNEREVFHVDAGFQWPTLRQSADSMSLFSEKILLDVRMPGGKPGDKGSKALIAYCETIPEDKILLMQSGKLESASSRTKWFKKITECGVMVQVWPLRASDLPGWIKRRGQSKGLNLNPAAVQIIAERVEGNMLAADQEIEKLLLLYGQAAVDENKALQAVSDSSRFNLYQLADDALAGNLSRCARMLHGLQQEDGETVLILWALARDLRILAGAAAVPGQAQEATLTQLGVWQSRQMLFKSALRRLNRLEIAHLIRHAAKIDLLIKGVYRGPVWEALLRLIAGICAKPLLTEPPAPLPGQE